MIAGGYWKALLRKLNMENGIKPDEYEVFNGSVVFWFYDSLTLKGILKKMNEAGIPYTVEWDREEGLVGIVLKKDILK